MRLTINKIKLRQLRGTIKYKTNVKGKKTNKKRLANIKKCKD